MVVVWFFGFLLEPSKNWLMDLELWILPKWFCPSCVSCFQLLCGVGFIWSQHVTRGQHSWMWANQIEQQPTRIASATSVFLVVNEVGIFFNHPTSAYSMFHPMGQDFPPMIKLHISFVKSLDARILVCRFFFEPNIDMPVALPRGFGGQWFRQKKKELWYFYSLAVNEQALLKYWKKKGTIPRVPLLSL